MDGEELAKLRSQVDEMGRMLHSQISLSTLDVVQSNLVCSDPPVPSHDSAVVGIDHKINEVIDLLEWDNDKPAVAVVVHGIGGAGKTTLANEVFASLNLQSWKYSKVTLIKNLELNPNIEEIQSQILSDLTGRRHSVRDFQDGQQKLKSITEKEYVFIYIDNILKREHLEKLLPKLIDSTPKKVRILATARKTTISGVFESCGIRPCKLYSIESLSVGAAVQLLCRKIDSERDIQSMVEERAQVKKIAEKCSCCPLFLEVVGAYLHKRNNEVEAYEKVCASLRDGDNFSCDKEDGFEESRILFAYHELTLSAQEAFLDICSFFYNWEWNEVACIVGKEELDCLLEGALVKRIQVIKNDKSIVERVRIHDLLLTAGRHKSKGNRFRNVDDFLLAMENEGDLHQTKGVWLYNSSNPVHVPAKVLDTMSGSLRVLAMKGQIIVSGQCSKRFDKLRFLQAHEVPNLAIDVWKLKNLSFMDIDFKENEIWSLPKNFSGLQVLKLHRSYRTDGSDIQSDIEFGHLIKLKHLELHGFHITEVSSFVKLYSLQKLKLSRIQGLKELPGSVGKLRSLQELHVGRCDDLMQLGEGFGELGSLTVPGLSGRKPEGLLSLQLLNISNCPNLLRLPEGLEDLTSLKFIDVSGCRRLTCLPLRVWELSFRNSRISIHGIPNLKELPEEICKFRTLTSLSLKGCKNLKVLPIGFGKLGCLERLDLSGCDNIQELCSDFGCLGALKYLQLFRCRSLSKLPDGFGQLGCLESLKLSMCTKLKELCSDFDCLTSLIKLDLSNCESLGEKWMDNVGSIQSLWRLDIARSEKMIRRWIEMQREKENWHFVVLTDSSWKETQERKKALLMLKIATSKIFDEEGLLVGNHGRPIYSSSLPPASSLIFIIEAHKDSRHQIEGNLLLEEMQQLELNSRALSVIYAGTRFHELPSEVTDRIVAYTPSSPKTDLFFQKMSATFSSSTTTVFRSRDGLEEKGIKCLSIWEDISYISNELAFLLRAPRESNIEILRAVLKTDFLFKNSQEVKLIDLQGKVILLLRTSLTMSQTRYSAFKDMYMRMQGGHPDLVEVVWIPDCYEKERDEFERAAADAPWPVVPNPWLLQGSLRHFFSLIEVPHNLPSWSPAVVVVVDGKGKISNKNAWEMIERWGKKAFPFSVGREKKLRKSEWEKMFNYNQFIFKNLPFSQIEVKEGSTCGEMMLLFVGREREMLELSAELEYALTNLKSHFQLYYIRRKYPYRDRKRIKARNFTIPTISQAEGRRFWERMKYLNNDLTRMGSDEKIVHVRRMVSALVNAECRSYIEQKIQVMVVDEKGEMVSGRGKVVVEALLQYSENDSKELTELKMEGVRDVLRPRREARTYHHHRQCLMLPTSTNYANPPCTICSQKACPFPINCFKSPSPSYYYYYQSNVRENYVECTKCALG